jgi:hypothetical protein
MNFPVFKITRGLRYLAEYLYEILMALIHTFVTSCLGEKKKYTTVGMIAGGEAFSRNNSKYE